MAALELFLGQLKQIYTQAPFCHALGMQAETVTIDQATLSLPMQEILIGNPIKRILHGGVISTVLDSVGGLLIFAQTIAQDDVSTFEQATERFSKTSTIDLRIDYLRPGRGSHFTASATCLRRGRSICVTQMLFHNEQHDLLAIGIGTYSL